MPWKKISISIVSFVALFNGASAQESALGAEEFTDRCAICHGETGDGSGVVGELFAQKPKNLRILARENGGTFPLDTVIRAIDGRETISAHGTSEMPIWGEYLMVDTLEDRGINPKDARSIVNGRILTLTHYIQMLQVE